MTSNASMAHEDTTCWKWSPRNLYFVYGRELFTDAGPAFALQWSPPWFALITPTGKPEAIIPESREDAAAWLNSSNARPDLSSVPTAYQETLSSGLNEVTVAVSRKAEFTSGEPNLYAVLRARIWNLEGYQPKLETKGSQVVVYYKVYDAPPDLFVMAQLHATKEWPVYASMPRLGNTVGHWTQTKPTERRGEITWSFETEPPAEWKQGLDWKEIVNGLRVIETSRIGGRNEWYNCKFCGHTFRANELQLIGNLGEIEEWPQLGPVLPVGRCPTCSRSVCPSESNPLPEEYHSRAVWSIPDEYRDPQLEAQDAATGEILSAMENSEHMFEEDGSLMLP